MTFKKYSTTVLGLALAIIFWIIEALAHSFIFNKGNFFQHLIPHDLNELWMRSLASLLILAFGIYANVQIANIEKSKKEKEKIQKRLEEALTKTLSGFIPICASCKKIRTKDANLKTQQSWENLESYVSKKSEAQFSHTICPECASKLYKDIL